MCIEQTQVEVAFLLSGFAYALGGDDLCVFTVAPNPLGLPLSDRGCGTGALFEIEGAGGGGGGGAGAVLCALGEVDDAGGRSEP